MGNCQAAEVTTVVIQHPGGKVERVYWSVSASRVMADNPGHYVAVIITAPASSGHERKTNNAGTTRHGARRRVSGGTDDGQATVKHLKLLRPDDTLLTGHVYRLVSFEEVVRKFETKRHAKLSKLVVTGSNVEMSTSSTVGRTETEKECQGEGDDGKKAESEKNQDEAFCDKSEDDEETDELVSVAQALISSSRMPGSRPGQWRPALQSISEVPGT